MSSATETTICKNLSKLCYFKNNQHPIQPLGKTLKKAGKEGQSGQTYLRLDHLQENFTGFGNVKSIGELSKSNSAECGKGV